MRTIALSLGFVVAAISGCADAHSLGPIGEARHASGLVFEPILLGGYEPSLSGDGRWLVFMEQPAATLTRRDWLVDLDRGERTLLDTPGVLSHLKISGDGSTIVYATLDAIAVIDRGTLVERRFAFEAVGPVAVSDDGRTVAFAECDGLNGLPTCEPRIALLDLATGALRELGGPSTGRHYPDWVALSSEAQHAVYDTTGPLVIASLDDDRAQTVDGPLEATQRLGAISNDGRIVVATRDDGSWVRGTVSEGPRGLDLLLVTDGAPLDLGAGAERTWPLNSLALAGDGSTSTFGTHVGLLGGTPTRRRQFFRMQLDAREPELIADCAPAGAAAMSDDGSRIVVSLGRCADDEGWPEPMLFLVRPE